MFSDSEKNPGTLSVVFSYRLSVVRTTQLLLCREMITVYYELHTKHTHALCGKNVELLNVETKGTQSNHWAV